METTKRCSKCKQSKPISEFYKNRSTKDGLDNECKICRSKRLKEYNQTEQGKAVSRRATKKYHKTDKGKAEKKRYRQSEKGKASNLKWSKKYQKTEQGKLTRKHFNTRNPNQIKAVTTVNHAITAGKLISPKFLLCHYCPKPAQQYHHWHGYEPEHWLDVVPACAKCHHKCRRKIA